MSPASGWFTGPSYTPAYERLRRIVSCGRTVRTVGEPVKTRRALEIAGWQRLTWVGDDLSLRAHVDDRGTQGSGNPGFEGQSDPRGRVPARERSDGASGGSFRSLDR